jgi:hypothetical protein
MVPVFAGRLVLGFMTKIDKIKMSKISLDKDVRDL